MAALKVTGSHASITLTRSADWPTGARVALASGPDDADAAADGSVGRFGSPQSVRTIGATVNAAARARYARISVSFIKGTGVTCRARWGGGRGPTRNKAPPNGWRLSCGAKLDDHK